MDIKTHKVKSESKGGQQKVNGGHFFISMISNTYNIQLINVHTSKGIT